MVGLWASHQKDAKLQTGEQHEKCVCPIFVCFFLKESGEGVALPACKQHETVVLALYNCSCFHNKLIYSAFFLEFDHFIYEIQFLSVTMQCFWLAGAKMVRVTARTLIDLQVGSVEGTK